MFLSILFACSTEFQSLDHKEPTYVNEMFTSQSDKVRNDPSIYRGDIEFTSEGSFSDFCDEYTSVTGEVRIYGEAIHTLEGLSCLKKAGNLHIEYTNVESLYGLKFLTVIDENLTITRNPKLQTLQGLGYVDELSSDLEVSYNVSLEDLYGLENIHDIHGDLILSGNPTVENLEGLESLEYVAGSVSIIDNEELTSFEGLSSLQEVGEDLRIEHNERITDMTGWNGLTDIGGALRAHNNPRLKSFEGMDVLKHVLNVSVLYNAKLHDVGALSSVKEMESAQFQFNAHDLCTNDLLGVPYLGKHNPYIWNNTICQ
ncbi:MAG: hypothetical protein CL916_13960 [Deltaproteobacteria bacterium]|nr:hypothetical protein [Deltaproteobacteria bacterium]